MSQMCQPEFRITPGRWILVSANVVTETVALICMVVFGCFVTFYIGDAGMQLTRSCRQYLALGLAVLAIFSGAPRVGAQEKLNIEVVPQIGHPYGVTSVAFSPDGTRVLSGSWDNTLKFWDAATGALLRTFEGHSYWLFGCVLT